MGYLKNPMYEGYLFKLYITRNLLCILQEHGDMWDVALCLKSEHNEAK